ncbi:hypothetical protein WOLCODRAFT_67973, partial [Wolfiporia cocos MD-104 SS10]
PPPSSSSSPPPPPSPRRRQRQGRPPPASPPSRPRRATRRPPSSRPPPTSPPTTPMPRTIRCVPAPRRLPIAAHPAQADASDTIDMETFHQILDLDEDDTHDFSKGMAWAYFTQASTTFVEMDEAYTKKDLAKLSSLGHFLKGSSAALGVARVQASCEQIQHFGQLRDEAAGTDLDARAALARIGPLLTRVKHEYATAEAWLKKWYRDNAEPTSEDEGE